MRKRLNIHWIEEIRPIPKVCSDCGKPLFWGVVTYEIESNYLACEDCFENGNWPKDWHYIVIEEYDPEIEFKFFRDETMMNHYDKD